MSIGRRCGLAVIIVVICPVILGYFWPSETETVEVWDVEQGMDITGDLATRPISVFDAYTGPLNNLSVFTQAEDAFVFPTPRSVTSTPNAYPISTITSYDNVSSVTLNGLSGIRYGFGSYTGFTYSGDGGTYSYGDYWPTMNVLVLYDSHSNPVKTATPSATDTVSASDMIRMTFGPAQDYIDITQGLSGSSGAWIWVNGMHNRDVTMWVKMTATPFSNTVHIGNISITRSQGMISASSGGSSQQIGTAYDYIKLQMTTESTTITGLIGVDGFTDAAFAEGNSITLPAVEDLDHIQMTGAYMSWWVKSTVSAISTTKGIKDMPMIPESYFPSHAWQVQIINPSRFGDSITIQGQTAVTLTVGDGGNVTVTNATTGDSEDVPIRDLKILSLVIDGKQQIYVNGIIIMSGTPTAHTVTFAGDWYMSVIVSKVTQGTATNYVWHSATFGFDQTAFCVVGLLACVCVAIGGSLWGRTTGESVLVLHVTMIVCGIAYLIML